MTTIFAEMEGDAVGSAEFRLDGGPDGIGLDATSRLANGGYMVNVDAQFDHAFTVVDRMSMIE